MTTKKNILITSLLLTSLSLQAKLDSRFKTEISRPIAKVTAQEFKEKEGQLSHSTRKELKNLRATIKELRKKKSLKPLTSLKQDWLHESIFKRNKIFPYTLHAIPKLKKKTPVTKKIMKKKIKKLVITPEMLAMSKGHSQCSDIGGSLMRGFCSTALIGSGAVVIGAAISSSPAAVLGGAILLTFGSAAMGINIQEWKSRKFVKDSRTYLATGKISKRLKREAKRIQRKAPEMTILDITTYIVSSDNSGKFCKNIGGLGGEGEHHIFHPYRIRRSVVNGGRERGAPEKSKNVEIVDSFESTQFINHSVAK